jgi:membrane-bound lytic murein transglycosylase D
MRNNYDIESKKHGAIAQKAIEKQTKKYEKNEKALAKISEQATPYLYYIVEQLEKRNMPGELALLPMLESAFQPQATSNRGAVGLWQFIASTGRMYGLKQDASYDGRRDIKASTKAALDHLESLYETFDHDWPLALAAYNAGEGAVQRAIKRNRRAGKPTHYWDLKLPKETQEYVPKLLALANIIGNPDKHDLILHPIANKPYFVSVYPTKPLHFGEVAKMAEIDLSELKRLNAGYRKASTHPNGVPKELLLPVANAKKFEYNLKKR